MIHIKNDEGSSHTVNIVKFQTQNFGKFIRTLHSALNIIRLIYMYNAEWQSVKFTFYCEI